jgi:zinc protease
VGNYILGGGGFVSRLMTEVREKRGLVYGVSSYFQPLKQSGPWLLNLQTKTEQAQQAVELVNQVVDQFIAQGVTEGELQAAKDNLINGFALRIDSNRKLLDNLAVIGFYGLPLNYLDTWTTQVNQVTAAQIKAAFQAKLKPQHRVTVIVAGE